MTSKKKLKQQIRTRASKTGESYTEARRQTLGPSMTPLSSPEEIQAFMAKHAPGVDWAAHIDGKDIGSIPNAGIECIFCRENFRGVAALRTHSASCQEHPAVQEAQRLSAMDRLTAAELRARLEVLEADIKANGVDEKDLVEVRTFGDKVPRKTAEHLELKKLLARAESREERAAAIKVDSKLAPTEAMKKALAAWGVTVMDGMLIGPAGVPLKAKWSKEPAKELAVFSKDAEVQLAATTMTEVFKSLMGQNDVVDLTGGQGNYWVWEAEYPEEGHVEITAMSAMDAMEEYRREAGLDDSVGLMVLPVSAENDLKTPKKTRRWEDLKREMYKDRPEALEKIERLVDQDIAEMLGSDKKFRIGDVDFPIGSLAQVGRLKSITEDYYTKLPCGHLVLNPDSEAAQISVKEMSEKFGIDANAELRAMVAEEKARHANNECLDFAKEVFDAEANQWKPSWEEIAKRSPTPEEQKAYVDSLEGGTDATMLRRIPSPFDRRRVELTEAEWKERAMLADPAELKKFIGDPTARVIPLTGEEQQKVARVVSNMTSPVSPIPTNVEVKFPSTSPVEEVGYLEEESFSLVKMEKYPCGHSLRKSTEIPMDLRAMYGDAGVEAWNSILEQERQKHLNGKCSEASNDLKLVPRFAPKKHMVVLVLMNDKGQYLYPPDAASYEPPPSIVPVIVNGEPKEVQGPLASYEELLWQAGLPSATAATITYRTEGFPDGTLTRGQRLELLSGMIFNVVETTKA